MKLTITATLIASAAAFGINKADVSKDEGHLVLL